MHQFEWQERKNELNIRKHGLDFMDAVDLFDGPHLMARAKTVSGEERWLAIGRIDDLAVTAIFTIRGDAIRMISLRRARRGERERYSQVFSD
jgi:uncharacterized protein